MDVKALAQGWEELSAVLATELAEWRAAHPRATLTELEGAVQTTLQRLQARLLSDLAAASPSADLGATPPAERPRCPDCDGELVARGQRRRQILTAGQPTPLSLRRSYAVCRACGRGLFPPG
ncbi:MAG TPA: hypothetical protein VIU62_04740 [Chloroflexota bacterium]|jgi:hypothetical protein